MTTTLDDIQRLIENRLPPEAGAAPLLAGSIGESPSKYSRSPGMWNAAFRKVGLDACYVPFDVRAENLGSFVDALRGYPGFMGANVTVPYKLAIMPLLDEVDEMATRIGAVNTFEQTTDGRLVGHNSDADGLIASILRPLPGQAGPFLDTLVGSNVLLIGAGGAARAAAFALAANIAGGNLTITNRSLQKAEELAAGVAATGANASAADQDTALALLGGINLVVNASTVGQSGIRHLSGGKATSLEPFSSLAPADPATVDEPSDPAAFWQQWFDVNARAIGDNNQRSLDALRGCDATCAFVDAVYSPDETVLLRHARWRGHRTLNGKGMLIQQAASSFVRRMTRRHLEAAGLDPDALYDDVVATMASAY